MGTFNSREIIDQIIAANGDNDEGQHRLDVVKIVQYITPEGETTYGAVYRCEVPFCLGNRYATETRYIRNPKVIWTRKELGDGS